MIPSLVVLFLQMMIIGFLALKLDWSHLSGGFDSRVFASALVFTVKQATVSSAFCILLGLIGAPGYARLGKMMRLARWTLLMPNIMSSILVVLCVLLMFRSFPFGFWGVVIGHVFINSGLATIWLGERWRELEARWRAVAAVQGAGFCQFVSRIVLPQMLPMIAYTFAVIFSFCLVSFAVPLVLGGGPAATTLEVLIFERLHTDADVTSATLIALSQAVVQFAAFFILLKPTLLKKEYRHPTDLFMLDKGLIGLALPVFLVSMLPTLNLIFLAASSPFENLRFLLSSHEFVSSVKTSLVVALAVGPVTFAFLAFLTLFGWKSILDQLPALSGIVIGLFCFLFFGYDHLYLALIFGHLAAIFLVVFRLSSPALRSLRGRFQNILMQLGASKIFGFKKVYFPQGGNVLIGGAVLATCWSMGEFSVSSMLGVPQATLPLYIQSLLGSYRLEQAATASLILLAITLVSSIVLERFSYGSN